MALLYVVSIGYGSAGEKKRKSEKKKETFP